MTIKEARKFAWDWIMQDGDDSEVLEGIAEIMTQRYGIEAIYRGGKLFIGGEEIEAY